MTATGKTVQDWNLDDEAECEELLSTPRIDGCERDRLLREYAHDKLMAIGARVAGYMGDAAIHEARCDAIYASMPEDIRW